MGKESVIKQQLLCILEVGHGLTWVYIEKYSAC